MRECVARGEEKKRQGGRRGKTGVEGRRRTDKVMSRGMEQKGGRAEDTAAVKPVMCQISCMRSQLHIVSQ